MIRSMTAFARSTAQTPLGEICWELRSVNHRYLEISQRLPDEWRSLETPVREHLQQALKRGKIDCFLRLSTRAVSTGFTLNTALLQQLLSAAREINQYTGDAQLPSVNELLRWPGVLETQQPDAASLTPLLLATLDEAVAQLLAHRAREGAQITQMLEQRCAAIAAALAQVRAVLPEILRNQRERLEAKLSEFSQTLNRDRLEQELVYLMQKTDVAEELDRIDVHLTEVQQALQDPQPTGRRLDFLMQELHREANTLGSKSIHTSTTLASVHLKVLIEQMREQIQNIE